VKFNRSIVTYLIAASFLAMAGAIFETTSNNYFVEVFGIGAQERGQLELPREFPGLMVAVFAGVMFFLGEIQLAVVGSVLIGLGMFGLTFLAGEQSQYGNMLLFLVVWSTGAHVMMPVQQSLALALAEQQNEGEKLGKFRAIASVAAILGCLLVHLNFKVLERSFGTTFVTGGVLAMAAGVVFIFLKRHMPPIHHGPRPKLVVRRRYGLFYVLSVLFGLRKQLFITFGPMVLILVYKQKAETFATLWIVTTLLGMFLLPYIGRLIDRVGERAVLMGDAAVLVLVCLTYGFAREVLSERAALYSVYAAYIVDKLLFHVQMARTTYLSKIAESRSDINVSLGLSVSLNHAVSIPMAILGGWVWVRCDDHKPVFMGAAVIAVVIFCVCHWIRVPPPVHPELVEGPEEAEEDAIVDAF